MKISMSVVWDRTTAFLSERTTAVAGIAALAIFVPSVVGGILGPVGTTATGGLKVGLFVLSVALGILSLWGQAAITALALAPERTAGEARAVATGRLPAVIGVTLLLGLIGLVLMLPIVGALIAGGIDITAISQAALQQLPFSHAVFITLYGLFATLVFFYLLVRLVIVSTAVAVAEGLVLGAIRRSFRLTRGLTWKLIGVLLLYLIVAQITGLAVTTAAGAVLRFLLGGGGAPLTTASILTALLGAVASAVFSVIATAFATKLYLATRAREDAAAGDGLVLDRAA